MNDDWFLLRAEGRFTKAHSSAFLCYIDDRLA